MKTADFDYLLPEGLIAQTPVEPRDQSRLMCLSRRNDSIAHRRFCELPGLLRRGDVLVLNDSRVIPARLYGRKRTGGKAQLLLLRRLGPGTWEALGGGKHVHPGCIIDITNSHSNGHERYTAEIISAGGDGVRVVRLSDESCLSAAGKVPLPPYIRAALADPERYQTVYSRVEGSAAAPTAGLHLTAGLLDGLRAAGIELVFVTLHIGLDTFRPVKEEDPALHAIHREHAVLSPEAAAALNRAKKEGRRVIGAGTTAVRVLEHVAGRADSGEMEPFEGWVDLFILPGYRFRAVDALITNFHLPRSTLLMLVTAFTGRELIMKAYREAIDAKYRFYSFGDAMLID
ncbi:MAG: tRNA preQ1(34) S-adenosylmethionine ribosyltransferase-isomerase QueA [Chloroflexi bacterium]|nr:tRNA preQ1(34) S-adenosylmethionine ribosyltransferase-isomerase QueA [Chloroflexota bacterium]